jgi:hypothetical protein
MAQDTVIVSAAVTSCSTQPLGLQAMPVTLLVSTVRNCFLLLVQFLIRIPALGRICTSPSVGNQLCCYLMHYPVMIR